MLLMLYAPPCLQRNLGILGSQSHSQEWSHRFSAPGFPGQSLPHPADGASRSRLWLTPNPPQSHVLKGWPGPLGTARGLGTKRFVASLRAAHLTSEDVTVPRPHPRPSDPYSGDPGGSKASGPAQTSVRVRKRRHGGRHCQAPRSSRLGGWVDTQHPTTVLEAPSGPAPHPLNTPAFLGLAGFLGRRLLQLLQDPTGKMGCPPAWSCIRARFL